MNKQLIFGTLAIVAVIGGFFTYAVVRVTKTSPQNTPDAGLVQQEEVSQDSMRGTSSVGGIAGESATGTGNVPTTAPSPSVSPVTVSPTPTRTQPPTPTPGPTPIPTPTIPAYTLADLDAHSDASNCWMAIRGKVYDVTSYLGKHPGGNAILKGCGKDATALFEGVSGHLKQKTLDLLPGFYKGDLRE